MRGGNIAGLTAVRPLWITCITYLRNRTPPILKTPTQEQLRTYSLLRKAKGCPSSHLCLGCKGPILIFSSSSRRQTSSSWMRGLGAGLGGMVGSWMKGWDGCALLRGCELRHGCIDPDLSTQPSWDFSWLVLRLDPLTLLNTSNSTNQTVVWC